MLKVPWEGDSESLHEGDALELWDGDAAWRLWRHVGSPFRPVTPEVLRWLDNAEREGSELVPFARELLEGLRRADLARRY